MIIIIFLLEKLNWVISRYYINYIYFMTNDNSQITSRSTFQAQSSSRTSFEDLIKKHLFPLKEEKYISDATYKALLILFLRLSKPTQEALNRAMLLSEDATNRSLFKMDNTINSIIYDGENNVIKISYSLTSSMTTLISVLDNSNDINDKKKVNFGISSFEGQLWKALRDRLVSNFCNNSENNKCRVGGFPLDSGAGNNLEAINNAETLLNLYINFLEDVQSKWIAYIKNPNIDRSGFYYGFMREFKKVRVNAITTDRNQISNFFSSEIASLKAAKADCKANTPIGEHSNGMLNIFMTSMESLTRILNTGTYNYMLIPSMILLSPNIEKTYGKFNFFNYLDYKKYELRELSYYESKSEEEANFIKASKSFFTLMKDLLKSTIINVEDFSKDENIKETLSDAISSQLSYEQKQALTSMIKWNPQIMYMFQYVENFEKEPENSLFFKGDILNSKIYITKNGIEYLENAVSSNDTPNPLNAIAKNSLQNALKTFILSHILLTYNNGLTQLTEAEMRETLELYRDILINALIKYEQNKNSFKEYLQEYASNISPYTKDFTSCCDYEELLWKEVKNQIALINNNLAVGKNIGMTVLNTLPLPIIKILEEYNNKFGILTPNNTNAIEKIQNKLWADINNLFLSNEFQIRYNLLNSKIFSAKFNIEQKIQIIDSLSRFGKLRELYSMAERAPGRVLFEDDKSSIFGYTLNQLGVDMTSKTRVRRTLPLSISRDEVFQYIKDGFEIGEGKYSEELIKKIIDKFLARGNDINILYNAVWGLIDNELKFSSPDSNYILGFKLRDAEKEEIPILNSPIVLQESVFDPSKYTQNDIDLIIYTLYTYERPLEELALILDVFYENNLKFSNPEKDIFVDIDLKTAYKMKEWFKQEELDSIVGRPDISLDEYKLRKRNLIINSGAFDMNYYTLEYINAIIDKMEKTGQLDNFLNTCNTKVKQNELFKDPNTDRVNFMIIPIKEKLEFSFKDAKDPNILPITFPIKTLSQEWERRLKLRATAESRFEYGEGKYTKELVYEILERLENEALLGSFALTTTTSEKFTNPKTDQFLGKTTSDLKIVLEDFTKPQPEPNKSLIKSKRRFAREIHSENIHSLNESPKAIIAQNTNNTSIEPNFINETPSVASSASSSRRGIVPSILSSLNYINPFKGKNPSTYEVKSLSDKVLLESIKATTPTVEINPNEVTSTFHLPFGIYKESLTTDYNGNTNVLIEFAPHRKSKNLGAKKEQIKNSHGDFGAPTNQEEFEKLIQSKQSLSKTYTISAEKISTLRELDNLYQKTPAGQILKKEFDAEKIKENLKNDVIQNTAEAFISSVISQFPGIFIESKRLKQISEAALRTVMGFVKGNLSIYTYSPLVSSMILEYLTEFDLEKSIISHVKLPKQIQAFEDAHDSLKLIACSNEGDEEAEMLKTEALKYISQDELEACINDAKKAMHDAAILNTIPDIKKILRYIALNENNPKALELKTNIEKLVPKEVIEDLLSDIKKYNSISKTLGYAICYGASTASIGANVISGNIFSAAHEAINLASGVAGNLMGNKTIELIESQKETIVNFVKNTYDAIANAEYFPDEEGFIFPEANPLLNSTPSIKEIEAGNLDIANVDTENSNSYLQKPLEEKKDITSQTISKNIGMGV